MNLLLDSHALLWALHDPGRMQREAVESIRDPNRAVFFSAASAWELELKAAKGKLTLPDHWLAAAVEIGFLHLPVTAAEARASAHLPWHHSDPFDRMLVAQARIEALPLATDDAVLASFGVDIVG